MERHPDQIAREEFLKKSKMADNMKCCWAQSQEVKVNDNGIVETVYAPPPPYPVYTSTPTPMYENFPKLLVKKLDPEAIIPTKANSSDAGYDLYALNGTIIEKNTHRLIKTGISMAIPEGHVGLIWPRSGLAYKHGLDVFAGVIDSGYRGDIGVILFNSQYNSYEISKGDRIAQILIQKVEDYELLEVKDLDSTERNCGGFGSSGA
jgi:dUTP pyrophosphatase